MQQTRTTEDYKGEDSGAGAEWGGSNFNKQTFRNDNGIKTTHCASNLQYHTTNFCRMCLSTLVLLFYNVNKVTNCYNYERLNATSNVDIVT